MTWGACRACVRIAGVTTSAPELAAIPGIAESRLDDASLDRLPASSAPAPWAARLSALIWWHRALGDPARHLPAGRSRTRALPITVCALVRYAETPVGPYGEILVSPLILADSIPPASCVPFIAVDSIASVHGGRENWGLPKVMAQFDWGGAGAPSNGTPIRAGSLIRVQGGEADAAWAVGVRAGVRRRALPFALPLRSRQFRADGSSLEASVAARGRFHIATVDVSARGPTLPELIEPGRHRAVMVEDVSATVGAARERAASA